MQRRMQTMEAGLVKLQNEVWKTLKVSILDICVAILIKNLRLFSVGVEESSVTKKQQLGETFALLGQ